MVVDVDYNSARPMTTQYSPNGIVYWCMSCNKFDFNDVQVQITARNLNDLVKIYPQGDIVLNHITAIWTPTTSGAGISGQFWLSDLRRGGVSFITIIGNILSLATATTFDWKGNIVVTDWKDFESNIPILKFVLPAGTVTTLDDISFNLEGMVFPRPELEQRTTVVPVSVEGYKWPLIRR